MTAMTCCNPGTDLGAVREHYAKVASGEVRGECHFDAKRVGYTKDDLAAVPEAVRARSQGCGNAPAVARIEPGDTVLDIGSGAGMDLFIAARRVGPGGRVIGIDATPEMVSFARGELERAGIRNAEVILATAEKIPLPDASVDVVISNCVLCLTRREESLREIYRVLKPGRAFGFTDIFLVEPAAAGARWLAPALRYLVPAVAELPAVELSRARLLDRLRAIGFREVEVVSEGTFAAEDVEAYLREGGGWPSLAFIAKRLLYHAEIRATK